MQPNKRFAVDRRSVIKGAGAGVAAAASPAVGLVGARRQSREAHVEILSNHVQVTPAGAAIIVNAALPEGGFIVVYDHDDDGSQLVGVNHPALGQGVFPRMMIAVDASKLEPGRNTLTAALYKDNGNRTFDEHDDPYHVVSPEKEVSL